MELRPGRVRQGHGRSWKRRAFTKHLREVGDVLFLRKVVPVWYSSIGARGRNTLPIARQTTRRPAVFAIPGLPHLAVFSVGIDGSVIHNSLLKQLVTGHGSFGDHDSSVIPSSEGAPVASGLPPSPGHPAMPRKDDASACSVKPLGPEPLVSKGLQLQLHFWDRNPLYYEQIAPASTMLAEPKVELQRWVVRGVYDRSVLGIPQVGITVEGWGTDITLQGLYGEQRHRLLKRYRQTQDVFDFLDGVLLYCARDPIEPGQPFFSSLAAVQEMRSTVSRELTKVALWLSGLMEGSDSGPPRAGTDTSDSAFLLRAVRLAVSDPETSRIRQDIVNYFLWSNKDNWESAPGPSLFGWLGTTLKRAWLRWVNDGTLDGDVWIDGKGHSHKGRQKQDLRGDKALDYIANRDRIGARGARRPDCSDYDRDVESGHGFYEWAEASGELEEIETDEYRTAELQEIETAQRLVSISDGDLTNEGNQEIAVTRRMVAQRVAL